MKTNGTVVSRVADVVLILAALTMLGITLSDRLASRRQVEENGSASTNAPGNWKNEIATGITMGRSDAPVTIIEFMDFQCPFCAHWAARVDSLLDEHPTKVRVVIHHFPLNNHSQALPAAIAVECADQQGLVREFQRAIFQQRGQMGNKPWTEFAQEIGVPDLTRFGLCILLPADSFPRIAYGKQLGERSGIRATPTVWINGRVERPTLDQLREMVEKQRSKTSQE